MKLECLKEFNLLLEVGNFSRTAQMLNITQPALSKHIANLEAEIGAKLLSRSTHGFEATAAGLCAQKAFRDIVSRYEVFLAEVNGTHAPEGGMLRIGIGGPSMDCLAKPMVIHLLRDYPDIEPVLHIGGKRPLIQDIAEGIVDVGLVFRDTLPEDVDLVLKDVRCEHISIALASSSPLLVKSSLALEDLAKLPLAFLHDEPETAQYFLALLESQGMAPCEKVEVDDLHSLPRIIRDCGGFFLAPNCLISELADELVIMELEEDLAMTVSFVYREDKANSNIRAFVGNMAYPK